MTTIKLCAIALLLSISCGATVGCDDDKQENKNITQPSNSISLPHSLDSKYDCNAPYSTRAFVRLVPKKDTDYDLPFIANNSLFSLDDDEKKYCGKSLIDIYQMPYFQKKIAEYIKILSNNIEDIEECYKSPSADNKFTCAHGLMKVLEKSHLEQEKKNKEITLERLKHLYKGN